MHFVTCGPYTKHQTLLSSHLQLHSLPDLFPIPRPRMLSTSRAVVLVATALLLAVCCQASHIPIPSAVEPDISMYGHRLVLDTTSTAVLSFNKSSDLKSGSWVMVSWSGVAAPDAKDMVALYTSPLDQAHAPLKVLF